MDELFADDSMIIISPDYPERLILSGFLNKIFAKFRFYVVVMHMVKARLLSGTACFSFRASINVEMTLLSHPSRNRYPRFVTFGTFTR